MTPNIKTNNALELNFNPIPNPSQRVTFEVQEDFNSSVFISPELGEILDEEDRTVGWDADEDLSHVLKQQRSEERKKRSSEHNQKKKDSRKSTSLSNGNWFPLKDIFSSCLCIVWLIFCFMFNKLI